MTVVLAAGVALAAPGDLDPSFGSGGKTTTEIFGATSRAESILLESDGKIVLAGTAGGNFALVRYLPTGIPDPDFGEGGAVSTFFGPTAEGWAVVREPAGTYVVAGNFSNDIVLARYANDGAFLESTSTHFTSLAIAFDMVRQADGKLVVSGLAPNPDGNIVLVLARYHADGTLDEDFGTDGVAYSPFRGTSSGASMVLQPDGKLVVVAERTADGGSQFALARFTAGGTLDSTFGIRGVAAAPLHQASIPLGVLRLRDGNLIAVGSTLGPNSNAVFAVVCFSASGQFDRAFGVDGLAVADFVTHHAQAFDAVEQPGGKIVLVGDTFDTARYIDTALARFTADGALDTTFGDCGRVVTQFERERPGRSELTGRSLGKAAVVDAAGGLLVAGRAEVRTVADFALLRYDLSGTRDDSHCRSLGGGPGGPGTPPDLLGALPTEEDASTRKEKKTAKKLIRLVGKVERALAKADVHTGKKQHKAFKKARKGLGKMLKVAQKADEKGTLGTPLAPIEQAIGSLLLLIPG